MGALVAISIDAHEKGSCVDITLNKKNVILFSILTFWIYNGVIFYYELSITPINQHR